MAEKEGQAHEFARRREWAKAIEIYDQILNSNNFKTPKERVVACLLGRSEACAELNRHDTVIGDCRRLLKMLTELDSGNQSVRRRLISALCHTRRFHEAESACREWLSAPGVCPDFVRLLDRYRSASQLVNGQKTPANQRLMDEIMTLEEKLEASQASKLICSAPVKNSSSDSISVSSNSSSSSSLSSATSSASSGAKKTTPDANCSAEEQSEKLENSSEEKIVCSYCAISFADRAELRAHCQTESHQNVIMSDEGRDWKCRPPPRGYSADSYTLCESFAENSVCHYGNQCVEAHGDDELNEWKERFEYRRMRLQRACEKELYGKSYTEQLLDKWLQAPSPEKVMKERVEGVEETCSNELVTTVSAKVSKRDWMFVLKTKRLLRAVALLQDAHRNHFSLKQVFLGEPTGSRVGHGNKIVEADLTSDQEWVDAKYTDAAEQNNVLEHRVKVVFTTEIYGTFRQSVVFDFGTEPVLVKHLCVDVIPVADADKITEIKKEIVLSSAKRWDDDNSIIVPFTTPPVPHMTSAQTTADAEYEKDLLERYPCPRAATFTLTQATIVEKKLTKNNYRNRNHELLYVEEIARYEQVARYNLTTKLTITTNYLLTPSGMATSTAKYSHSGELFALMTLGKDVSEDTSAGRLILNNCTMVYLSASIAAGETVEEKKRKVYEAPIEDKGKNVIYLKLSAVTVNELGLKADTEFSADVQFQLNRLTYCEWHQAIDKIADFKIIFPETILEPSIPWTPKKQWSESLDPKLNTKQKEAVVAITTPMEIPLPPILLIGPFGTGKTYTLAQAIRQLLQQPEAKVLICTHSNSAADLYIKDYLHPWVEAGEEEARPLRVYYHKRWVATVNSVVQKYCLIETTGNARSFRRPTVEDIMKTRIVVVTLSISMELASLDLPKGYFTHILLDEAAQAMECEAIMPLALASENTRIVLAGDHMQMSPELFSNFAKERRLHISLLERLYDHYPADFPCKILLCENYRAHEAIIKFTSELFYDQKLIASGKQPRHEKFYPLTFFTTRGEDVQDKNSTAFYNNSEVYEVVERVAELRKRWPPSWGKMSDQSIGIMTPYADQVFRIRSELRKRRMGGISVERVLNVQGKQFRAIFLSTVRTRRTCTNEGVSSMSADDMDYGFLSNSKLLNTAITRAQSLVAVVGDPVALCSIGRCRKVWERFIDICNQNKSLFGITWSLLRSQLDGVELKKTYVLNPLAPEFIPRALQAEAYLRDQSGVVATQSQYGMHPPHRFAHPPLHHHHPPQQPPPQFGQPQANQMNHGSTGYGPMNHMRGAPQYINQGPPSGPPPPQQHPPYNSYPFYYYQQQQAGPPPPQTPQPQAPMMRPPQQSQQPQTPQVPSTNLWGSIPANVNPAAAGTAAWQMSAKQNAMQQLNINMQRPHNPPAPSLRSPGGVHPQIMMPYMQQQQQQQMAKPPPPPFMMQQQQRGMTGPMSPAAFQPPPPQHHEHLTNDIMASLSTRNVQPPPMAMHQAHQQQPPPMPSGVGHSMYQGGGKQMTGDVRHPGEKDIQFLQNVHFPERLMQPPPPPQQLMPSSHPQISHHIAAGGLNNLQSSDFGHLLPPNMSFYEMSLEPKEFQLKWFFKLVETQGLEVAHKFAEILRQVPTPSAAGKMAPVKDAAPQAGMNSLAGLNTQVDLAFDSLMSGSSIPQPMLRELFGGGSTSAASHGMPFTSSGSSSGRGSEMLGELTPSPMSQQSVPLYRRQASQQHYSSSASSAGQSVTSGTPDLMDNHHHGSLFDSGTSLNSYGSFMGNLDPFAAGLPSIQTLAAGLQPHMFAVGQQPAEANAQRPPAAGATYASVLTQGTGNSHHPAQKQALHEEEKDPFAAIRELGQRSNGYYNYFQ
ncbi:probable helicase with zinc finger domain [Phlebotomus argentipes]|uniref:probable helicase with zinc finger domain n=1 Tax=Phlebotomus argentipes TaxID=94469 RepID=UPI00289299AB|nr:probable helicase with zinc finger domain [Phlebotomus argentipes]